MQGQNQENCPLAIVRDIDHKPLILQVLHAGSITTIVADEKKSKRIGFPSKLVYRHDRGLFGRMKTAYASGKTDLLNNLWSMAQPYEPESEG